MYNLVNKFINNMSLEDVNNFARRKNIILSQSELEFTYMFLKKNASDILKNPKLFDIDRFEHKYSKENFIKIKKVFIEYFSKYQRFF